MSHVIDLWSGEKPLDIRNLPDHPAAEAGIVQHPDEEYRFLHDCMLANRHGKLYLSWYNCPVHEMADRSVIRGRISSDCGNTWSDPVTLAEDPANAVIYVPPAFGICPADDQLYLLVTRMTGPDVVQDLEIFRLNEQENIWHSVRVIQKPFLPNTPVYRMINGKLITAGRVAAQSGMMPEIPAVAISDDGKIDTEWRIVPIHDRIKAPEGENYLPETCIIPDGEHITAFVRHDNRYPLIYESHDCGETWSGPQVHNIPVGNSKIFAGILSDQRRYMICNLAGQNRDTLALLLSKPGEKTFSYASLIRNGIDTKLNAAPQWSYPVAVEVPEMNCMCIACTCSKTSAAFIRIPLDRLEK